MAGIIDGLMWRGDYKSAGIAQRMLIYAMAGGLSVIGHAGLIWYGGTVMAPASLANSGARQIFAVQLTGGQPASFSDSLPAAVRKSNVDAGKYSAAMDSVKPEQLFPAFYGVHYYEPKELTQKPFVAQDIPRDFALYVPHASDNAAIFLLLINEKGGIDRVIVESSSLPQSAQAKLEDAFSAVKFFPGQIKGVPVKSALKIQIRLDTGAAEE